MKYNISQTKKNGLMKLVRKITKIFEPKDIRKTEMVGKKNRDCYEKKAKKKTN